MSAMLVAATDVKNTGSFEFVDHVLTTAELQTLISPAG
jgi:hypothetical protein